MHKKFVNDLIFELCAETLEACRVAAAGGAHRIELCTALAIGGLTPETALLAAAVERSGVPVHVLLRPTAETFRYTPTIMNAISLSMEEARRCGASGFVLGLLQADGQVDVPHCRALVQQALPLPVTFHRAFDATPDLEAALEDVISTGCTRLLTSGGAPDVLTGAPVLARLVQQAGARLDVAAGGGLTQENAMVVARATGCRHYHASLRQRRADQTLAQCLQTMLQSLAEGQRAATPALEER